MSSTKDFIFLGGLPRAGSTLLCNILAQNPSIYATATSGVLDEIVGFLSDSVRQIENQAQGVEDARRKRQALAILGAAYSDIDKPVIVEKSRGWVAYAETLKWLLGDDFRIVVPVRDLRDVLASMEKLWRQKQHTDPQTLKNTPKDVYFQMQTIEGRLDHWMELGQIVGLGYSRVRDVLNRGWAKNIILVTFEALTATPKKTMQMIYSRCNMDYFEHNFENVGQATQENDAVYGFKDLHAIQRSVTVQEPLWPSVLGGAAKPYEGMNFWA